jgi:hypothetical protein
MGTWEVEAKTGLGRERAGGREQEGGEWCVGARVRVRVSPAKVAAAAAAAVAVMGHGPWPGRLSGEILQWPLREACRPARN